MIVRSKVFVSSVEESGGFRTVKFSFVYSPDELTENHKFWSASPSGNLKISGASELCEKFQIGTFWYVDHKPVTALDGPHHEGAWSRIPATLSDALVRGTVSYRDGKAMFSHAKEPEPLEILVPELKSVHNTYKWVPGHHLVAKQYLLSKRYDSQIEVGICSINLPWDERTNYFSLEESITIQNQNVWGEYEQINSLFVIEFIPATKTGQ